MENEQKCDVEMPSKDESSVVTRRRMLQVTVAGALIVATGLHVAYQRSKARKTVPVAFQLTGSFNRPGSYLPSDFGCCSYQMTRSLTLDRIVIYSKDSVPVSLKSEKNRRSNGVFVSQQNRIRLEFSLLFPQEDKHISIELQAFGQDGRMLAEGHVIHQSNEKTYAPRLLGSRMRSAEPVVSFDICVPDGVFLEDIKTLNVKVQEFVFSRCV